MEKNKFVGYGRMIESKYSKGFAMSINMTELINLYENDPDVLKSMYISEFNGNKYLNLVAWSLKEPQDKINQKMTHSVRIDTYQGLVKNQSTNNIDNSLNQSTDDIDDSLPF